MTKTKKAQLVMILENIYDEANYIIGTEVENHREVAIKDSQDIKRLAKAALKIIR